VLFAKRAGNIAVVKTRCLAAVLILSVGVTRPLTAADSPHAKLRGVDLVDVRWTGGFWAEKFELCRRAMLPSVEAALLDERNSEQLINLKIAAGLEQGSYRGTDWSDGDCYKWIEAMAHMYAVTKDAELDRKMDYWISVIAKAQAPDGYLSTNIQLDPKKKRWEKVQHHALYNMGHLITAACTHKRATGKDSFLNVARKVGDHLHGVFAPRPPALARMDFNPSQMMALVDLYRVTGERRYLELADVFITMRGSAPATREEGRDPRHQGGTDQTQDRVPLRKETQAVGHAVTGTYLWCGAADLYMETGERALWAALERVWESAALRRTYITGGACAQSTGRSTRGDEVHEAFGGDHELPNRTAYNETCANIGNAMWNWRMLQITGDAKHAEVMERVLYNSALSAVSADGRNFFYANPLAWDGRPGWPTKHYTGTRWFVHGCYCCPPQVARTIAGLGRWAYSTSPDAVWVHLYGGNRLDTALLKLTQATGYPWDGRITFTIEAALSKPVALMLRIPSWAAGATARINGQRADAEPKPGAYLALKREWRDGDKVELSLPMKPRLVEADPRVQENRNCLAVMRGPVVYCMESVDLPAGVKLAEVRLPRRMQLTTAREKNNLGDVVILKAAATRVRQPDWDGQLYRDFTPGKDEKLPVTFIPYHAWANRGITEMSVWLPAE
jgi:DUF1680 family protein